MKNKKGMSLIIGIIAIVVIAALIIVGLKVAGVGPFASGEKIPEKYEHTSANGITTWDNGYMREDLTALELTKLMGNGINLGNTMEAYGRASIGTNNEVSLYETFWGQPVTTQEMITTMKNAGFDTLRIPIAWTNAMDFETGDYTIGEAYLNRVEEIINYALNEDMYVIINDHWDGGWWGKFGSATQSTRDEAMAQFVSMWTQIAERYAEYSDYLIFEAGNEEIGNRLNDLDLCPDSGSLSQDECYEMAALINQTFVDTVRATGGNNENRFLLIPGYNTDVQMTCDDRTVMPTDTADSKLLISVHYYTPFGYCGNTSLNNWGTVRNYGEQNTLLEMLTEFTEQGYGVIIGEYQVALTADGTVKNNTTAFLENFLNNCDLYNYCPVLWDCSSMFKRSELTFLDADVEALFKARSYAAQSSMTEEEIQAAARAAMDEAAANAVTAFDEEAVYLSADDKAIAWIMYNSQDYNHMYSVGDVYDPVSKTDGMVVTDVEITEAGTYTVGLDFTGTTGGYAVGTAFSAIGISNGELMFPGYCITITEILVNGEPYEMIAKPYTTSDDARCTRMNLFNEWVTIIPDEARTADGNLDGIAPTVLDNATLSHIETLMITFEYGPAE